MRENFFYRIWHRSHRLGDGRLPLLPLLLMIQTIVILMVVALLVQSSNRDAVVVNLVLTYFIMAYQLKTIRYLIRESPVLYQVNRSTLWRYSRLVFFLKQDLLWSGIIKLVLITLYGVVYHRYGLVLFEWCLMMSVVLIYAIYLFGGSRLWLSLIITNLVVNALSTIFDYQLSALLTLGTSLILCIGLVGTDWLRGELQPLELGKKPSRRHPIWSPFIGYFSHYKWRIALSQTLFGIVTMAAKNQGIRVDLIILLTIFISFEVVVFGQLSLYKGKGEGQVHFMSQTRFLKRVLASPFALDVSHWYLGFLSWSIVTGEWWSLKIAIGLFWNFCLLMYVAYLSQVIIVKRQKRPNFLEEYLLMVGVSALWCL